MLAAGVQPDDVDDQFIRQILQVVLALAITLGTIWGLSKVAINKRWTRAAGEQRIKVVDSLAVGARDRIMLIEVDNRNILVASTPGQIRPLHAFEKSNSSNFQTVLNTQAIDGTSAELQS